MIETIFGLLAFCIGASLGSFLNVVADRLPAGMSIVSPRSHCPRCRQPIPVRDLVPIASYLWLRGRCRLCGERIPGRVIAVEVITAALFVAVYLKLGYGLPFIAVCAGVALMVAVAVVDLEHRVIPDRLVLPATAVLAVLAPFWPELGIGRALVFEHVHLASLANSLAAGAGAFFVFLAVKIVYSAGIGAGDVKMAGMLGLLVGWPSIAVALWTAVVAGGVVAIGLLVLARRNRKDAMPFGPFISAGGILALVGGTEATDFYLAIVDRLLGV